MTIRCMIVDDEPLARKVLEKYISSLPFLKIDKKCSNAIEAAEYLHENEVDLIFLDIKMPGLSGIDFIKTLSEPPKIIITSAYSEYAIEGFEYSVTDYLLKPFSFERFLKAVNKVPKIQSAEPAGYNTVQTETKRDFIFVKADKINHKVKFSDIRYIEGYGNFIKIFVNDKMLLVSDTEKNMEKQLPEGQFLRVHKSYIININSIKKIEKNVIDIGEKVIPVGKYYKMNVEKILEQFKLKN